MLEFEKIFTVDKLLQAYLIFVLIDFITGFLKAYKIEGFKSRKLRDGMVNVLAELVAIFFAGILDSVLDLKILLSATKWLFLLKEAISILENLGQLGVEMPRVLKDKIQDLKDNYGGEEEGGNK